VPVGYLTPTEAARQLGMTRSGVLWMVDTRRLHAVRTDTGRRLISRRDVERLRKQREALKAVRGL
jgi:excisionase family DNA binding protein